MEATADEIQKQIAQVVNKTIFFGRRRIVKVDGLSLYPSEVHLLLTIEDAIDANATQIAERLGVTKGAVSQTLSRLEGKGVILKGRGPRNQNELALSLTDSGRRAYELCRSKEVEFSRAHEAYLSQLGPEEKEVVLAFLRHMEKVMDGTGAEEPHSEQPEGGA